MKRLFLDTNILVDLVCYRKPFVQEAERIFALAAMGKVSIAISAISYINTVYIARKYDLSTQKVLEILKNIASFTTITDLNESTIKDALDCGWNDFEDAVQYFSSQSFVADCIITRNPKDFEKSSVPVYTPIEFLQMPYWMDTPNDQMLNEPDVRYGEQ